jgi:hypothetical protein
MSHGMPQLPTLHQVIFLRLPLGKNTFSNYRNLATVEIFLDNFYRFSAPAVAARPSPMASAMCLVPSHIESYRMTAVFNFMPLCLYYTDKYLLLYNYNRGNIYHYWLSGHY